jgi:hypothetical protein
MLQRHVAVRQKHGWGAGLEQTFYSPLDLKAAAAEGVKQQYLTAEEAATEVEVLTHFAPRVDAMAAREAPTLERFRARLRRERVNYAGFARKVSRFFGGVRLKVPVFLIADPDDGNYGGGYNGERLALEIPRVSDPYPTLLHESFHAFIETKDDVLGQAVEGVPGLDLETLSEGLAYAIAPGLYHPSAPEGIDPLRNEVARQMDQKKTLADAYTRFNRYGLALRPALAAALENKKETILTFAPRAVDIWRAMMELEKAQGATGQSVYRTSSRQSVFVFGDVSKAAFDLFQTGANGVKRNLFGRPHRQSDYDEMLGENAKPGDLIVLLLTAEDYTAVPSKYADLLPLPAATIGERLQRGETVVQAGKARDMKVLLLAAPTQEGVETLIRSQKALWH